jgi:hypothetical protein
LTAQYGESTIYIYEAKTIAEKITTNQGTQGGRNRYQNKGKSTPLEGIAEGEQRWNNSTNFSHGGWNDPIVYKMPRNWLCLFFPLAN